MRMHMHEWAKNDKSRGLLNVSSTLTFKFDWRIWNTLNNLLLSYICVHDHQLLWSWGQGWNYYYSWIDWKLFQYHSIISKISATQNQGPKQAPTLRSVTLLYINNFSVFQLSGSSKRSTNLYFVVFFYEIFEDISFLKTWLYNI